MSPLPGQGQGGGGQVSPGTVPIPDDQISPRASGGAAQAFSSSNKKRPLTLRAGRRGAAVGGYPRRGGR